MAATGQGSELLKYVVRRLIYSIPVILIASVVVFWVVHITVSPAAALNFNPRVSIQDKIAYKKALGLDRSGVDQYLTWLSHFARGDWGKSLASGLAVGPQMRQALANTLELGIVAMVFSLLIGMAIGVYSSVRQYSLFDYATTSAAFFGISIPTFWFGLIMQLVFGLYVVRWFHLSEPIFFTAGMFRPGTTGFDIADRARHITLPAIVLAVQLVAVYSRYMRASMLDVLGSDYLRTARAKGLSEGRVIVRHGVRTALIPLTTQVAIDIGTLAGGLVVTESIFQWPGMGSLFLDAMNSGDYAIVLPWVVIVVVSVIVFNLLADILYAVLDPRIRYA
jgi:peptide/nickel transport system permease protein